MMARAGTRVHQQTAMQFREPKATEGMNHYEIPEPFNDCQCGATLR